MRSALGSTVWQGPARERFESDWHSSFEPALGNMKEAFDAAGTECKSRASRLCSSMAIGHRVTRPAADVRPCRYDPGGAGARVHVEPFVEGQPGPHVTAAVDAATAAGAEVDFGPFGSTCRAADDVDAAHRRRDHPGGVRQRRHPRDSSTLAHAVERDRVSDAR